MTYVVAEYQIKEYVERLFHNIRQPDLVYHNLGHTQKVVAHCREIAAHYDINGKDHFILMAAAWFHDTGHLFTTYALHEKQSVSLMTSFFATEQIYPELTDAIAACIMATQYPPHPTTLLEEVICDADTYHFGTIDFRTTDSLVRKEAELRLNKPVLNWNEKTLQLLTRHQFYTPYCQRTLERGKQENILYLQSLSCNSA